MPDACTERLILFTRYPEPGNTKTRMIPVLGAEGAAELQSQMTEHIASKVKELLVLRPLSLEVRYDGGDKLRMREWLGDLFVYRCQGDGDIGQRMKRAIADGFEDGCEAVVIIGSDIPGISCDILQMAFEGLKSHGIVLGPAVDGGYYLVGLHRNALGKEVSLLFEGICWGTDKVFSQSLEIAKKLGLSCLLLDTINDIDRPEDLALLKMILQPPRDSVERKRISVIIPTLNESSVIEETIASMSKSDQVEIIVVDGGSLDNTVELAKSCGARVLSTASSKAGQMNTGAAEAQGDVLLFLHADTRLPDKFDVSILKAAAQNGFSAGAFHLGIDTKLPALRFIERVANWRSRFLKMPYGDQTLFIPRELFNTVGGFPDLPIMEDFELIRRLRRKGKIIILPESVRTSPRRWLNLGILKTWLLNQTIIVAYHLGIPSSQLARWYRRDKGKSGK